MKDPYMFDSISSFEDIQKRIKQFPIVNCQSNYNIPVYALRKDWGGEFINRLFK